jgi:RNA polymerase sigma-70 factor (ECF subfamily)
MDSGASITGLIQRARRGGPQARERLLESYRNYLKLLARTGIDVSLQGKADPSDLVQEALLKAHQGFGQFRGTTEADLVAWLRQIMARLLVDFARRYRLAAARRVGRERSLEDVLAGSAAALGHLVTPDHASPSRSAERRELSVVLADALAELSDDHRDVIVLRSIEELSWEEVARRMRRSPGAVRMLWARALKLLRPLIEARL